MAIYFVMNTPIAVFADEPIVITANLNLSSEFHLISTCVKFQSFFENFYTPRSLLSDQQSRDQNETCT